MPRTVYCRCNSKRRVLTKSVSGCGQAPIVGESAVQPWPLKRLPAHKLSENQLTEPE
jgi:hypothetical protein